MTNLLKLLAIAILAMFSTNAYAGDDCVDLSSGQACTIAKGEKYGVGPKGEPAKLIYTDCEKRGEGEFECWAAGIRTGRLFVHRKNGRLFAALAPKGE